MTYDRYDAEWEHPDTGRTASTLADDDETCEVCGGCWSAETCECEEVD